MDWSCQQALSYVLALRDIMFTAGCQMLRERRSPKGQGLIRKEGPPTYAILLRNLVLSQFTRNERHPDPAFVELSTKAILFS